MADASHDGQGQSMENQEGLVGADGADASQDAQGLNMENLECFLGAGGAEASKDGQGQNMESQECSAVAVAESQLGEAAADQPPIISRSTEAFDQGPLNSSSTETGFAGGSEEESSLVPSAQTVPMSPAEIRAIDNYANSKGLPLTEVSLGTVSASHEGILHWACLNADYGARSPESQCFGRALAHSSTGSAMYRDLTDDLKLDFRKSWSIKRSFEFTKDLNS